jgi:hypothetical protein
VSVPSFGGVTNPQFKSSPKRKVAGLPNSEKGRGTEKSPQMPMSIGQIILELQQLATKKLRKI